MNRIAAAPWLSRFTFVSVLLLLSLLFLGIGKLVKVAGVLVPLGAWGIDFNLFALITLALCFFGWLLLVRWLRSDCPQAALDANVWSQLVYFFGLVGLGVVVLCVDFGLGLWLGSLLILYPVLRYIQERDGQVEDSESFQFWINGLVAKRFGVTQPLPVVNWFFDTTVPKPAGQVAGKQVVSKQNSTKAAPQDTAASLSDSISLDLPLSGDFTDLASSNGADPTAATVDNLAQATITDVAPDKKLAHILDFAVNWRASDIQIRAADTCYKLVYRIDGVLRPGSKFEPQVGKELVDHLKNMASLDVAERRRAQNGNLSRNIHGRNFEVRIATQPTYAGEQLNVHLLDRSMVVGNLESLGMRDQLRQAVQRKLSQRQGLFIVGAPPGSGTTTTLCSSVLDLDAFARSIITIEDPVEYRLENVTQVNVAQGDSFSDVVRSVLRQDPDVLMLGEIDDVATAEIACEAANKGLLVLAGVQANNAVMALYRLIELGVDGKIVANAGTAALSQRLVRRLCEHCRVRTTPDKETIRRYSLSDTHLQNAAFYAPPEKPDQRCKYCGGIGFRGRTGVFQILDVTQPIRELLHENAPVEKIRAAGRAQGTRSLASEGIRMVLQGKTTFAEIERVIR